MVNTRNGFAIDATFLFDTSREVFFGTPLLVVDGEDHTLLFGVVRDLLRLRRSLGIHRGAVVIGKDTHHAATTADIEKAIAFLRALGMPVVHDPETPVRDLCALLDPIAEYFVTRNRNLLRLAGDRRLVILVGQKSDTEVFDGAAVTSSFGVGPAEIPAFLALTDGPEGTVLTRRQATALLQRHHDLSQVLEEPSVVSARQIRNKLRENKAVFLARLREGSRNFADQGFRLAARDFDLDIDNDRSVELLKSHGFHSLVRLLPMPGSVQVQPSLNAKCTPFYHAVTTCDSIRSLVSRIGSAEVCALDTESSGKDPHTAELFGVSFSVKAGEAFYLPVVAEDLEGVAPEIALEALKSILAGPIGFVGHNVKYDYALLRRHGLEIRHVHFDTMLAAHECFGDCAFLNLPFLAKRLLKKEIKAYKDIVPEGQTFLDMPFGEILNHACEDADTTLQLQRILQEELTRRGLLEQYRTETLGMVLTLGNWEIDGVRVDRTRLSHLRKRVLKVVDLASQAIVSSAGTPFDPDVEKELRAVLRRDPGIADLIGSRKATLQVLEDLAISHPLPRLVVKHRRAQRQLRQIEAVLNAVENGRIHPVFNQTKNAHGQLAAVNPSLFEDWADTCVRLCFARPVKDHFRSGQRSLDIVQSLSGDVVLEKDRRAAEASGRFLKTEIALDPIDHEDLLLSTMIGMSSVKLCRRFLCNHSTVASIRHDLATRYSRSFRWLKAYRKKTIDRGFALDGDRRRWLDGLRSSDIEKRENAENSAVRWLLHY